MNELPKEILLEIFGLFSSKTLVNAAAVSNYWNEHGNNMEIWNNLLLEDFGVSLSSPELAKEEYKKYYKGYLVIREYINTKFTESNKTRPMKIVPLPLLPLETAPVNILPTKAMETKFRGGGKNLRGLPFILAYLYIVETNISK